MNHEEKLKDEDKVREKVPVLVKRREAAAEENNEGKQSEKTWQIPLRWKIR